MAAGLLADAPCAEGLRRIMNWSAALLALLVSHLVGDFLLQTDRQAINKPGGVLDPSSRRALLAHVATYTVAFVPALVWIGSETSAGRAVAVGVVVAVTHLAIDDGGLVKVWMREVKRVDSPSAVLSLAVDQTFHVVCLLGAALVAVA